MRCDIARIRHAGARRDRVQLSELALHDRRMGHAHPAELDRPLPARLHRPGRSAAYGYGYAPYGYAYGPRAYYAPGYAYYGGGPYYHHYYRHW